MVVVVLHEDRLLDINSLKLMLGNYNLTIIELSISYYSSVLVLLYAFVVMLCFNYLSVAFKCPVNCMLRSCQSQ